MSRQKLKSEITHKIIELRQKNLVEADCILDVLDDYLDPFIDELEKENAELKEKLKPENCLKLLAKAGYVKFTSDQTH